ncbi:DNA-binding protein [Pikeienuella piscinae]|uniref:DNA-binding protein n=2 Tax=Pikeienuella piscinae TaxID=2748098 RepID=A0A7M3T6Y5_9RHOB|nr:DNA-binding protein [Pikeienuella piscinae]
MREHTDPVINPETEAYWKAANDGKLLVKYCMECKEPHFYPRALCPFCMSERTEWRETAGRGRIYSFSVMRRADPVYAIAYVTLEEGVTMLTNIVDADPETLRVGQEVEVAFGAAANGQAIPLFRPPDATR